jgi:predicted transcriptional regulator
LTTVVEDRSSKESAVRRLPESELDVMEVLWAAAEPLTTRAVVQAVPDDRAWKIHTADRSGRDIRYTPLVTRDAYLAFETERFMERFHQGSLRSLLASFSGGQQVDEAERRDLEAWLDAHERGEA